MSNPPKKLDVLSDEGMQQVLNLAAPAADPTQTTLQGMAPIQMWEAADPILPDVGDVDNKILGTGGRTNTILISTTTAEVLRAITVSIGADGYWYIGGTNTTVKAAGTNLEKVLRPSGMYVRPALEFDSGTNKLTIHAGGAYNVMDTTTLLFKQFTNQAESEVDIAVNTRVVGVDATGNIVQLTDQTDPQIGTSLAPIAFFDSAQGDMRNAQTIPEIMYTLHTLDTKLAQGLLGLTKEGAKQLQNIKNAGDAEILRVQQVGQGYVDASKSNADDAVAAASTAKGYMDTAGDNKDEAARQSTLAQNAAQTATQNKNTIESYLQSYHLDVFISGLANNNELLLVHRPTTEITLLTGLPKTVITTMHAAKETTVWVIAINGQEVGTITWAAGSAQGVIAFANDEDLGIGDILTITQQGSADDELADVAISIVGVLK